MELRIFADGAFVGRFEHIQRAKCFFQLASHLGAGLTVNGLTGADDDQKACPQVRLERIVGGADDALGAVTLDGRADLFGDREAESVDELLFGVFLLEAVRGVIAEHVDGNRLADGALALPICFLIQMVFFDCNIFHVTDQKPPYTKNPDARKYGIGGFYVLSKILKN